MDIVRYPVKLSSDGTDAHRSWNVAVLADLHDAQIGRENADLVQAVKQEKVCAVLGCGDLMTVRGGPVQSEHAFALIQTLSAQLPVFLSNGNHEMRLKEWEDQYPGIYDAYCRMADDAGAVILDNTRTVFPLPGSDLKLGITGYSIGLSWYERLHPKHMTKEDITADLGVLDRQEGIFEILLAHHPDHIDAYAQWGCDLVLSGHLHGGMIRVPFLGGVVGGSFRPFPKYDRGEFAVGNTRMIVSAGLGSHTFKLRPFNPTQLVILQLCA